MVGPPDRVQAIHKLRLVTRQHGTRMHTDGASNLLMLSVRSCCSSSTTHRRTLPDHVGYFSVTFSDGGEMEARRRRDGGVILRSGRAVERNFIFTTLKFSPPPFAMKKKSPLGRAANFLSGIRV